MEGRPVSGRLSVRATYHANRLTSVTDWNMTTIDYAYDDAGRMTTATLPSGQLAQVLTGRKCLTIGTTATQWIPGSSSPSSSRKVDP